MVLLQEGIIGGPLLIGGALIAIIALILIIVFIVSLTKTSGTKEEVIDTGELKTSEPDDSSARKAKKTDNIILISILAVIAFILIKFLYWLGNIKFD